MDNNPNPDPVRNIEPNVDDRRMIINGVPTEIIPMPTEPNQPIGKAGFMSFRTPSRRFMTVLLLANLVTVVIPAGIYLYLYMLSRSGGSGTEFMTLVLWPFIPFLLATVIENIIYIPIYLIKSKPTAGYTALLSLVLIFSLVGVVFGAYDIAHRDKDTSNPVTGTSVTKNYGIGTSGVNMAKATELFNNCQIDDFIGYNGDMSLVYSGSREGLAKAEKYRYGIAYTNGGTMYDEIIYASKAQTPELLVIAKAARDKCADQKELKIYIDNTLEVKASDGSWQKSMTPTN